MPVSESQTASGFGATMRKDAWWLAPFATACGLGLFVLYSTWAAFQGKHFEWGPYLSPFYSPNLIAWFPALSAIFPAWLPASPAFLILWAPGGFRVTCYYYRKAYYRAYFMDPPACAVGEAGVGRYHGETRFPFILQNLHRYFLYFATILLVFLWHDVYKAFWFEDGFGVGVGTLVLFANTMLLTLYTFSCHSLRHIVGGYLDCFSSCASSRIRHKLWSGASLLNVNHMLWAWLSLFMVGFADLYVRMVSAGVWTDWRLL